MSENSFQNFYHLSPSQQQQQANTKTYESVQAIQAEIAALSNTFSSSATTQDNKSVGQLSTTSFLSKIEQDILRANSPINLKENPEEITVNGHKGILMNKTEISEWKGQVPLSEYQINDDHEPEIIRKRTEQEIYYKQDMAIRYLRPPTPPPPGDIYIRQENVQLPPAPPLIIRQQPPRPETPPPLVIREAPPKPPQNTDRKIIYIQGKKIPPPPRKVIIERLPPMPAKPQSIIIERWLPYKPLKRKVIFQRATEHDPVLIKNKSKNLIVQWEKPNVTVKKEFKDLGIVRANPIEYSERYGSMLKNSKELPYFIRDIKPPTGLTLAAHSASSIPYELEGDLHALSLVNLESEGLNEYKNLLRDLNLDINKMYVKENLEKETLMLDNATEINATSVTSTEAIPKPKNFIQDLFSLVDLNSSISLDEAENLLLNLYTRLGMRYGKKEANLFFKQIEFNPNGTIDLIKFRKVLEKEFL